MRLPDHSRATLAGVGLAALALIIVPGAALAHQAAHDSPPAHPAAPSPAARSPAPHVASPRQVLPAAPAVHHVAPRPATAPQSLAAHVATHSVPAGTTPTPTHANTNAYTASASVPGWNSGWRGDQRYDWVRWRASHRALFHPGYYYPPTGGYAYAAIGVGDLLAAAFLNDQYWIDDPSIYHLPPASDPYRWVRYYNDILLVDIDTGEVVDVVPDVFW